jgi:hypothetical protein
MRIAEEKWKVLASFLPAGWQQMAWQSGAVKRFAWVSAQSLPEIPDFYSFKTSRI